MLKEKKDPRSGQAIVEMVPSFILFLIVFTASVALFEVMSNAIKTQEAARNLAFAKISNSGTLISPPEDNALVLGRGPSSASVVEASANAKLSSANVCFSVYPTEAQHVVNMLPIYNIAQALSVGYSTKLSVYRLPGSSCNGL